MNIDATFTENQIANIKQACAVNGIELRIDGKRVHVGNYVGPPLRDHDGCDPDLRKLTDKELRRRGIVPSQATLPEEEAAAVTIMKNYKQLADVAVAFRLAREAGDEEENEEEDELAGRSLDERDRVAHQIGDALRVAARSEMPLELKAVTAMLPEGCDVITFVEASVAACSVPGCGGVLQAAWIPATPHESDGGTHQGAPDLLSQFVAASATAIGVMGRDVGNEEMARTAIEAARRAVELEMEHSALELSVSLWLELDKEAALRGIHGGQPSGVLAGALVQWGVYRTPQGAPCGAQWPWVNPAASLPVYSLVGAFLDEWNRAIVYAKSDAGRYNRAHSKYARATAGVACALGALALTAQREHDDYTTTTEHDGPERSWADHGVERRREQKLATWAHLVWKEAAGCMREEQAKCWERVRYFYNFRIKRGIEARPTDMQLKELKRQAHKHDYMRLLEPGPMAGHGLSIIDPVDLHRGNVDGLAMAGLAELHFGDQATEKGEEKEEEGGEDSAGRFDNSWRVCVARAEYDRSSLSPYPTKESTLQQASRLYGRFPRAQGWAPVETKDARELGMGLYTRYICGNCARWAPEASVCPGCKSIRFCSDKCRQEAMGGPTGVTTNEGTTYVNSIRHTWYCDGKKVVGSDGEIPAGFVFPTAINIYKSHMRDAIRMLGEHGMTSLNVLVHCTRRIDTGRDEVDSDCAKVLLAACTNAALAMRDRECMRYLHLLHWLPLFWTLFAPLSKRPCEAAAREMIRTPRRFATQFFELVVSWAPALLSGVGHLNTHTVASGGELRHTPNPTHNIPIYVLSTLLGMLRLTKSGDGFNAAFWDGMGRQLTNALIVVLLALEQHECRHEHNLRSLPDVILRILHHLSDRVCVQPTYQQVQRSIQAIGCCGWSRLRSRLARDWVSSVRLALSDRRTGSQSEWASLEATVSKPGSTYYANFAVPECHVTSGKLKSTPFDAHTNPNNFVAVVQDPPDTLAADGDPDHAANQSEDEEGDPNPRAGPPVRKVLNGPLLAGAFERRYAARRIQRAWKHLLGKRALAEAVHGPAPAHSSEEPSLFGFADLPFRPNEWIDVVAPCGDLSSKQTYADFKGNYFARTLSTLLAARPQQPLKLA